MKIKNVEKGKKEIENIELEIGKSLGLVKTKRNFLFIVVAGLFISILLFIFYKKILLSIIGFFVTIFLSALFIYFKNELREVERIKKIESAFPEFLQLMASNLRAGMTIDKAMLLSSRPELAPLDSEILKTGKDIATGKNIETAFLDMSKRTGSEKIYKTILLIISGIRAGGSLAVLLEQTAVNIRERDFVEKRAGGNVLMYVIFIFIAVSIGAPVLFSLSTVLVETFTNIVSELPTIETTTYANIPFTLSKINISATFVKWFSFSFMLVIVFLGSIVLGLVNKGEEKEGLKFLIPMLVLSIFVFFAINLLLSKFLAGLFG